MLEGGEGRAAAMVGLWMEARWVVVMVGTGARGWAVSGMLATAASDCETVAVAVGQVK